MIQTIYPLPLPPGGLPHLAGAARAQRPVLVPGRAGRADQRVRRQPQRPDADQVMSREQDNDPGTTALLGWELSLSLIHFVVREH